MLNCAVIGATGYTGIELVKILLRHGCVRIAGLTTRQEKPIPVRELVPTLPWDVNLEIEPYSFASIKNKADLVFLCLPHTEAALTAEKFRKAGKIVIDLSADCRLRDAKSYAKWYGVEHPCPEVLKKAVYGLPEIYRNEIQHADLIANPGCYPTGAILAAAPLLRRKLVDPASLVFDSKSGVSGAGKKLTPTTQFCEVDGNFYAYKVGKHQHTPEIGQVLSDVAGRPIPVTFVTHLLPVSRGILTTAYMNRRKGVSAEAIREVYLEAYEREPFIRIKSDGVYPCLRDVQKTNYCDIGFWADPDSQRVVVMSAIDNLLKGASGQAVQNMNIRCGFPEEEGLKTW